MENRVEQLKNLFFKRFGCCPEMMKISGGGSSRVYYRLMSEEISVVGAIGKDVSENNCFINLTEYFSSKGLNVPKVIACSPTKNFYLLEDLGDQTLLSQLEGDDKIALARKSLSQLVKLQSLPVEEWSHLVINKAFSSRLIRWDLNYFKYNFLKVSEIDFDEEALEDDFDNLTQRLITLTAGSEGFMYRDFQSRNIMIKDGQPFLIDYQGGRVGPIVYDLVSFLWQAKASFTIEEKRLLITYYISETSKLRNVDENKLAASVLPMTLFRSLQVLGAYGLRGIIEKKPHFIESIPLAVSNLRVLKSMGVTSEYPQLDKIIDRLEAKFIKTTPKQHDKLTISVYSFSYKKGYPSDSSGNGGGFMFDCRGLQNPGRLEEYKQLTGLDQPVKIFLEKYPEVKRFIGKAIEIVSQTVDNYLSRGFKSLQVGFGCTGGQHRSVYCAEKVASGLKKLYGDRIDVVITHCEQEIKKELK